MLQRTGALAPLQSFRINVSIQHRCNTQQCWPRQGQKQGGVMATAWLLGNQECFGSMAGRFGMRTSTLLGCVMSVCNARITAGVMQRFIKWPPASEQRALAFREKTVFPGVVGCIYGTHVDPPQPETPTSTGKGSLVFQCRLCVIIV